MAASRTDLSGADSVPAVPPVQQPFVRAASVGIPQGLVVDPASGEIGGAVRKGGELVSLAQADYELWVLLLTPLPFASIDGAAARRGWVDVPSAIARLRDLSLLVTIAPGRKLDPAVARLRPLPLGVGIGNVGVDPNTFQIQNASLSLPSPVCLDAIAIMFWWDFDGTASIGAVVERISARFQAVPRDAIENTAACLARDLMAHRLLYLDTPPSEQA